MRISDWSSDVCSSDLAAALPAGMDAAGWETVRPNLTRVADALDWWHVVEGPIATTQFDADDRAFLAEAHRIPGTIDWAGDPWHPLTGGLKAAPGRKGKPLFLPLLPALTRTHSGPDMAPCLPFTARARALERRP